MIIVIDVWLDYSINNFGKIMLNNCCQLVTQIWSFVCDYVYQE